MCSRHSELRGGNNCGAEEVSCGKMPWLPCITRASLPFSDRSSQIKSKRGIEHNVRKFYYFYDRIIPNAKSLSIF